MEKFKTEQINKIEAGAPKNENIDENGLPRELWPYRDEMQAWINEHQDELRAFLQYKNAKYRLICGIGFYHQPATDIISLSVPEYKEMKEKSGMTIDQIFFAAMHEFAHLKTMTELDSAGKHNHLAHFNYEERKRIEDKDDPTRFASLQPTYRSYYNISEDAIVNSLVQDTPYFGKHASADGARRNEGIEDFYTNKAFLVFKKTEAGRGTYIKNENPATAKNEPFIKVGPGQGNLEKMSAADYEKGFDWNNAEPALDRSGQFLTFFMKNQMIGLKANEIKTENNPEGAHMLNPDAALALTGPIMEVYGELLKRIMEKYKNEPAKLAKYTRFMGRAQRVPIFSEVDKKVKETEFDVVPNVFMPSAIHNDPKKREEIINSLSLNDKQTQRIILGAKIYFRDKLKEAGSRMGLNNIAGMSYLDIFNKFKEIDRRKSYSWTFPLKHNLNERMRIVRAALEPIFTMLCILDDSFDVKLPPEREGKGAGGEGGPKNPETPTWQPGDKVRNNQAGSPYFGRKGVITNIDIDGEGKARSVTVKYLEEENKMAENIKSSGETEEVYNPDRNLILIAKRGGGQSDGGGKDPRQKEFEGEEEKEEDPKEGKDDEDEGAETKPDDENNKDKKPGKPGKPGQADKEKPDKDLGKIINPYKKALEDMIAQDEREGNLKELEESEKTPEFREGQADKAKEKDLIDKLKAAEKKATSSDNPENALDKEIVKSYMELEKELAPYAEKMARNWLEVINNVANRIEAFKDKYYRSGKMDIKRLQKFLPELEMGADIDRKRIYEQFIEKVMVEIKPKMMRIGLLIDNSGSMSEHLNRIRMTIMLLNSSLRSLRILFKDRMREVLGDTYRPDMDIVCDTEIRAFGETARLIKPFDINNFGFLEDENAEFPKINMDKETVETLLAFKKIKADEGSTNDKKMWAEILAARSDETLVKLLADNQMTEIDFQISDGAIDGEVAAYINKLKSLKIGTAGMAIGGAEALSSLKARHKETISADTPREIVEKFGELLKNVVKERVEQPMIDYLDKIQK